MVPLPLGFCAETKSQFPSNLNDIEIILTGFVCSNYSVIPKNLALVHAGILFSILNSPED